MVPGTSRPHRCPAGRISQASAEMSIITGSEARPRRTSTSCPVALKKLAQEPPQLALPITPVSGDLKVMCPRQAVGAEVPTSGEVASTTTLSAESGSQAGSIRS